MTTDDELHDVDADEVDDDSLPVPGRAAFNSTRAAELAQAVARGVTAYAGSGLSKRFAYFADNDRFVIVADVQEKHYVDHALARGITHAAGRTLVLVLPRAWAFPTLQRVPFLLSGQQPRVFVYDGKSTPERVTPTRAAAKAAVAAKDPNPEEGLRKAMTPPYLGQKGAWINDLVEWAGAHHALDPGHRQGVRSWQCAGLRVLSVMGAKGNGLRVTAGIHFSKPAERPAPLVVAADITAQQLAQIKKAVTEAIERRLTSAPAGVRDFHVADEHWLQSVLRRDTSLVGIEAPALREVPAWRPKGGAAGGQAGWGRGFVDLVGMDAHGDLRLVETKVAANKDDMLVLQGLDYFVWSEVYGDALRRRVGADLKSDFIVHYVIGSDRAGGSTPSPFVVAQANALDIDWRFQVVDDWFHSPRPRVGVSRLYDKGVVPT